MKASTTTVLICVTAFLVSGGCSREEPPPPPPDKSKVVRPITMPAPKEVKPAAAKEPQQPETAAAEEGTPSPPETEPRGQQLPPEQPPGYYVVRGGETLSAIAARDDVYADPLKWPLLYGDNIDKLGELPPTDELPGGLSLKITSPDQRAENLRGRPQQLWAVNVFSTTTAEKITPLALRLLREGYLVYITRATVKGKQWMRLRVGFFTERPEADTEARKIMAALHLADSWVTKVGEGEREEFGGY